MVHQYKLIYFNARARAEPARLLFAYADVKYEDVRVDESSWTAIKPSTPFGQLPVLEIDGGRATVAQSIAICRYLANEFSLVPKDHIQAARADMLVDGKEDIVQHFMPWFQEKDPDRKRELWKKLEIEHIDPFLDRFEKFLTSTGTGYFVNNSITWADIFLFDTLHNLRNMAPHLFQSHARLAEFVDKLAREPKIQSWLENRPKTDF